MGSLYSDFKSRLEAFLGLGEDFSKIALVSHITKGVAGGLKDSSSHSINLLTCLTAKFMTDKYGDFIKRKGGLVSNSTYMHVYLQHFSRTTSLP